MKITQSTPNLPRVTRDGRHSHSPRAAGQRPGGNPMGSGNPIVAEARVNRVMQTPEREPPMRRDPTQASIATVASSTAKTNLMPMDARFPMDARLPPDNQIDVRKSYSDEAVSLQQKLVESRWDLQNQLDKDAGRGSQIAGDISFLAASQKMIKQRQDDLERFTMTYIKDYERKLSDSTANLNKKVNTLQEIMSNEIMSKVKAMIEDNGRVKRKNAGELAEISCELVQLKQGLLKKEPIDEDARRRFFQVEEQLRSLKNQMERVTSLQATIFTNQQQNMMSENPVSKMLLNAASENGGKYNYGINNFHSDGKQQYDKSLSPKANTNVTHGMLGGIGPYASKSSERSLREKKQDAQVVRDLIEEALANAGIAEKFRRLEHNMYEKEVETNNNYQDMLAKFSEYKLMQPGPKSASELLNDIHTDKDDGGGTGDSGLIARNLVERKAFVQLQEEVIGLRAYITTNREEIQSQKEHLRLTLETNMQQEKKRLSKEIALLWEEKQNLGSEVQKIAERLQESVLYLANISKNKDEATRNQVLDQCYSLQTIHQNEFAVVMRKMEQIRKDETTDKSELTCELERAFSFCNSLSACCTDLGNKLQVAKRELQSNIEEKHKQLCTRLKESEDKTETWVKETTEATDSKVQNLISRYEVTCKALADLQLIHEKFDLATTERFINNERQTESRMNGLERHTEKKLQILEFEVKSSTATQLLDFEEKVNKNIDQQEKNNRRFRKMLTQELIEKTRQMFTEGLTNLENTLVAKLEDNRTRIEAVNVDLQQLIREKMLDLQERMYRFQEENEQAIARLEEAMNEEIERLDKELDAKTKTLMDITEDLRSLTEETQKKLVRDFAEALEVATTDLTAKIKQEKESCIELMNTMLADERTERLKSEAERLYGIQKRLAAFEDQTEQVIQSVAAKAHLETQEEASFRQQACLAIDERAVALKEALRVCDEKHDQNRRECEEKDNQLGESILEIMALRELDQADLSKKLDLVVDQLQHLTDDLGVKLYEGDQANATDIETTKIDIKGLKDAADNTNAAIDSMKAEVNDVIENEIQATKDLAASELEALKEAKNAEIAALQEEINALKEENAALQTKREEEAAALQEQLEGIRATFDEKLAAQIEEMQTKVQEDIGARLAALEAKVDENAAQIGEGKVEVDVKADAAAEEEAPTEEAAAEEEDPADEAAEEAPAEQAADE